MSVAIWIFLEINLSYLFMINSSVDENMLL